MSICFLDPLRDCRGIHKDAKRMDGVFTIIIPELGASRVRCDMTTQPGGWIVFQRRVDATVDFNRNWKDYRDGFGDLNSNFWLGLEKLHYLAYPGRGAKLRVDLKHIDYPYLLKYAEYSLFEISNEADGYRLKVGNYSGTAGNSLEYNNGMKFTTKDVDNDFCNNTNCATYVGPWWHKVGTYAALNHKFPLHSNTSAGRAMYWIQSAQDYKEVVFSEMKIRF